MWFWSTLTFLTPTQHLCWITPEGSRFCGLRWARRYTEFVSWAAIFLLHADPMQKKSETTRTDIFLIGQGAARASGGVWCTCFERLLPERPDCALHPPTITHLNIHARSARVREKCFMMNHFQNSNLLDKYSVKNREIKDVKKSTWKMTVYSFDTWQLNGRARWLKGQGCFI